MSKLKAFLVDHPFSACTAVGGAVMTIYGFMSGAYELWTAHLPAVVWQAVGAAIFMAAILRMQFVAYKTHGETQPQPQLDNAPLELVIGQHFSRCEVFVAGKEFRHCQFIDVTFVVGPEAFTINNSTIGRFDIKPIAPGIQTLLSLLLAAGLLKDSVAHLTDNGPESQDDYRRRTGNVTA